MDLSSLPEGTLVEPAASPQAIASAAAALHAAMPGELAAFLALADGVTANTFAIYGCEALPERNATYEVGAYAPGFVTFGDDGGGRALMLRGGGGPSPVYLVDHGSMSPASMEEVAPSFADWIANGCPLLTATRYDLDAGAGLAIDAALVPEALRGLIPVAARWGFRSLDDQDEFVAAVQRERPGDLAAFNLAVDASRDAIGAWGDALDFAHRHVSTMTADDWAHPYWSFLALLKIREITGPSTIVSPAEDEARLRFQQELQRAAYAQATIAADEAFRRGDFSGYAASLAGFADLLTPAQQAKLALARKKAGA